jgi:starch phosphorylase
LQQQDVSVQLYYGMLDSAGNIRNGQSVDMYVQSQNGDGIHTFTAEHVFQLTGNVGFSVRILPFHEYLHTSFVPQKIVWA